MLIRTLVFAALLVSAGAASAQPAPDGPAPPPGGHGRGAMMACKADRETLCAGVERGGGRIMQCMKDNYAKLSPGCLDAMKAMRAARKAERQEQPAPPPQ